MTATFRERLRRGDVLVGTFLNTGSAVAAEICALAGFDWVLVDLEHGSATEADLLPVLQAVGGSSATPFVRVEANERARFTKVLDFGAEGVMVPRVDDAEAARGAVSHLRYGQEGDRGVALLNRGAAYGARGRETIETFNERVVGIVQIESEAGVADVDAIAAVDGVDVLFVGPSDLTHSLGIFQQTGHPRYVEAVDRVVGAARSREKALGVLVRDPADFARYRELGFTFVAFGSDTSFLATGARAAVDAARTR